MEGMASPHFGPPLGQLKVLAQSKVLDNIVQAGIFHQMNWLTEETLDFCVLCKRKLRDKTSVPHHKADPTLQRAAGMELNKQHRVEHHQLIPCTLQQN